MTSPIYPAMINTGVNCGNCVGGECAELHCFEDWTHGGGGPGGPYEGGGGGGPFPGGGWGGGSGTRQGCVDAEGHSHSDGSLLYTYIYVGGRRRVAYIYRCNNGRWDDVPY
jgi:hypothetical protein